MEASSRKLRNSPPPPRPNYYTPPYTDTPSSAGGSAPMSQERKQRKGSLAAENRTAAFQLSKKTLRDLTNTEQAHDHAMSLFLGEQVGRCGCAVMAVLAAHQPALSYSLRIIPRGASCLIVFFSSVSRVGAPGTACRHVSCVSPLFSLSYRGSL